MAQKSRPSDRRQRFFSLALLGCACAALPLRSVRAQTAESAPVGSTGLNVIETSGVYPTGGGTQDHYLDAGANGTYPSFAVLDFSASSFGLSYPVNSVSSLTLALTEAQYAGSKAGVFNIYLSEDTSVAITSLKYMTASSPSGLGTQLGDSSSLFNIGSFTSNGSTTGSSTDTFTLTLSSAAQSYFISQLNSSSGDLRLVVASNDSAGYASFLGNLSGTVPTAMQPTLAFGAVLNQPILPWTPGGSANTNGGVGTWLPAGTAGDTSWNGGPWNSSDTAQFSGTGAQVTIGAGGVSATGIQFNATGYTLGTTGGPAITMTSANGTTAPTIQVTNATDTATINAPLAGTSGINKTGVGTLVLGGTNTFTGGATITAGTLQISNDANLGDASNNVALAGGTLHPVGNFTTARNFAGTGGIQVDGGSTFNASGVVNVSNLTLSGAGTLALTNNSFSLNSGGASNAVTGTVTFTTAGATLTASSSGSVPSDGGGVLVVGGLSATQASGNVTLAASAVPGTATTITTNVANAGASLTLTGSMSGTAVIAKSGAGTLILAGDNSGLTGTGTPATSFRQGTAGASPLSGGIVSIAAANPNPGAALGTGLFDANGGTISNDSGAAITLAVSGISLGAQNATTTPGGLVFAGANPIMVTGAISLYRGGTTAYQHAITVSTPTTFTGMLTADTATGTSTGVTIFGSSTLTLAGTAANTLTEGITIATSGANAGVIAATNGTFAATTSITLNANAKLTLQTGNTINDAGVLLFQSAGMKGGQVILNNSAAETIGGLYLAVADGYLPAGYQAAGTYGATTSSGATFVDPNLFGGSGVINNLDAVMVPEPSSWAAALAGLAVLVLGRRLSRRA